MKEWTCCFLELGRILNPDLRGDTNLTMFQFTREISENEFHLKMSEVSLQTFLMYVLVPPKVSPQPIICLRLSTPSASSSHTNWLPVLFHYASRNLLSDLPPVCHFQPQCPSAHIFSVAQHFNQWNLQLGLSSLPLCHCTAKHTALDFFCFLHWSFITHT